MSKSSTQSLITRLFVLVVGLTLVGAELIVAAQNSNSSMSMQNDNMSASNMTGAKRRSPTRRGRRRSSTSMSNTNSACGPMQANSNMAGSMQENANSADATSGNANMRSRRRGRRRSGNTGMTVQLQPGQEIITDRPVGTGGCDPNTQTQEDLSGTYNGIVNYSEGGMSGDATLTINGNDFTLTSGSTTQEGRIVAVNTCHYIGATMVFGKLQAAAPGAAQPPLPPIISVTAKRAGGGITLTSAPGERREFSFMSNAAGASGGGAGRKSGRPIKTGIKPPTVRNHMQRAN